MATTITKETMSMDEAKTLYRNHFGNWWTHKQSNPRDAIEAMFHAAAVNHYEGFMAALILSGKLEVNNK